MHTRSGIVLALVAIAAVLGVPARFARAKPQPRTVWVLTKDGRSVEGRPEVDALTFTFTVNGASRKLALRELRSFHSADAATPEEAGRITAGLAAVQGKDAKAAEAASAALTDLGLPVLSPLLALYQDTDAHQPDPLYRLFGRIIPGFADAADRKLDLARLSDGSALRGKLTPVAMKLTSSDGKVVDLPAGSIRRLAVLQSSVERTFDLQALHDCTYVGWLDSGLAVTPASRLRADSSGYVRLSFDEDGWACDPDGIADPLPGKRRLQEGYRWGIVLGRVGPLGQRWPAGKHVEKRDLGAGRLYFAVNDNEHWQNNIGSYRVRIHVSDTYDLGEPQ